MVSDVLSQEQTKTATEYTEMHAGKPRRLAVGAVGCVLLFQLKDCESLPSDGRRGR